MAPESNYRDTCIHCGYSLHTLTDTAACPECGKPVRESREASRISRLNRRFIRRIPGGWKTIIASTIALFALGIACTTFSQGHVIVEEFCPQTFQLRTRSWYEIPYLNWRVTSVEITTSETPLSDYLREHGWLATANEGPSWFLGGWVGPAATREFGRKGEGWIRWSKANPTEAAILWPKVLRQLLSDKRNSPNAIYMLEMCEMNTWKPEELESLLKFFDTEAK